MPGLYTPPDYDLAGFIVGSADETALPGSQLVRPGQELVALASSGLHTNGYSLARRIVFDRMGLNTHDAFPGEDASVADVLLRVHCSYLAAIRPVIARVRAMAHITGGGIPGNLSRALPPDCDAVVNTASWETPNLFRVLEEAGAVARDEMFRAFNMGVGMVAIADSNDVEALVDSCRVSGVKAWRCGSVVAGSGQVLLNKEN